MWRYDPVFMSDLTPVSYHLARFEELSRALEEATKRCYVSFLDVYRKTERRLCRLATGQPLRPGLAEQCALLVAFVELARARGIAVHLCCDEPPPGMQTNLVQQARCVDPEVIRRLRPDSDVLLAPGPTRPGCGCARSVDIGCYETCTLGSFTCGDR